MASFQLHSTSYRSPPSRPKVPKFQASNSLLSSSPSNSSISTVPEGSGFANKNPYFFLLLAAQLDQSTLCRFLRNGLPSECRPKRLESRTTNCGMDKRIDVSFHFPLSSTATPLWRQAFTNARNRPSSSRVAKIRVSRSLAVKKEPASGKVT